ncbi:Potassium efflux system KefA protein / Small-conductance mechanosensitive channel [Minicystis rosea]|nr:Potassium efflux system KefA protein / Small-conductance mechanosensitive channel [Minicystis rosea]
MDAFRAHLGTDLVRAEIVAILVAAALAVVVRMALGSAGIRLSRQPLAWLAAHVATFMIYQLVPSFEGARRLLGPVALLLLLLSVGRSAVLLVVDFLVGRRFGRPLPQIFRDIIQGVVYATIALATLNAAGVEPGSLLTTSALLTAVVGLSLQETLGNLFAGLAIQMQRPFEVGDWIQFDGEPRNIGRIIEINWRATTVLTSDEIEVIVPNASLAKAPIRNFTRPTAAARRSVYVSAPYDIPPADVQRIILAATVGAPGVLADPPPSVITNQFGEYGIEYWVRFFTDQFHAREAVDGAVRDRIWYALRRARVEIPYPHRTLEVHQITEETSARAREKELAEREAAIRCVDMLRVLAPAEQRALAEMSEQRLYAAGEVIVRQGDVSSELFVIERGEVVVAVNRGGNDVVIARLGEGKFFGEMALVTGDRRTATVRAATSCQLLEVSRDALRTVLSRSPDLAERVSSVLTERQAQLDEHLATEIDGMDEARMTQSQQQLLVKIRRFFTL